MTQEERRRILIKALLDERGMEASIPEDECGQWRLLRALMNVREPMPMDSELLRIQDECLHEEIMRKGIVDYKTLSPISDGIYLWQGDITRLKCDAIVNAANSQMLGCFYPNHGCIDNAIHTYAGVELRLFCSKIMKAQGHEEPTGSAKITPAFNLPSKHVIHTVGPIVSGYLSNKHERLLASCYDSCLNLASEYGLKSIAFCCISTGEFGFPNKRAAEIAIETVKQHKAVSDVIFNVFKDQDYEIYKRLLK